MGPKHFSEVGNLNDKPIIHSQLYRSLQSESGYVSGVPLYERFSTCSRFQNPVVHFAGVPVFEDQQLYQRELREKKNLIEQVGSYSMLTYANKH